jgi:serine/threonine-protein kinase
MEKTKTLANPHPHRRVDACAFGLLGGELDCSLSRWDANEHLHILALRPVASDPFERSSNVTELLSEWLSAVSSIKSDINS